MSRVNASLRMLSLEARRERASSLDRTAVLLDDVVEYLKARTSTLRQIGGSPSVATARKTFGAFAAALRSSGSVPARLPPLRSHGSVDRANDACRPPLPTSQPRSARHRCRSC